MWRKTIFPACLPKLDDVVPEGMKLTILGWGLRFPRAGEKENVRIEPAHLQHGEIIAFKWRAADEEFVLNKNCPEHSEGMLCLYSAHLNKNMQTLSGDSGSPNVEVLTADKRHKFVAH